MGHRKPKDGSCHCRALGIAAGAQRAQLQLCHCPRCPPSPGAGYAGRGPAARGQPVWGAQGHPQACTARAAQRQQGRAADLAAGRERSAAASGMGLSPPPMSPPGRDMTPWLRVQEAAGTSRRNPWEPGFPPLPRAISHPPHSPAGGSAGFRHSASLNRGSSRSGEIQACSPRPARAPRALAAGNSPGLLRQACAEPWPVPSHLGQPDLGGGTGQVQPRCGMWHRQPHGSCPEEPAKAGQCGQGSTRLCRQLRWRLRCPAGLAAPRLRLHPSTRRAPGSRHHGIPGSHRQRPLHPSALPCGLRDPQCPPGGCPKTAAPPGRPPPPPPPPRPAGTPQPAAGTHQGQPGRRYRRGRARAGGGGARRGDGDRAEPGSAAERGAR